MSMEEVDYLVERIKNGIGSGSATLRDCAKESLDKLVEMATGPTRYTPREEVTEGWWSANRFAIDGRTLIQVSEYLGEFSAQSVDLVGRFLLEEFTDFLPVPAWLLEGIK